MTKKERKDLAKAKKRLQAEGVLPPNKPRLNRKKFAKEVNKELEEIEIRGITYDDKIRRVWRNHK